MAKSSYSSKKQKAKVVSTKNLKGSGSNLVTKKRAVLIIFIIIAIGIVIKLTQASTGWDLVFSEDFNGTSLDTTRWTIKDSGRSGEDHHQAYYRATNVSVKDGKLDLLSQRHCVDSSLVNKSAGVYPDKSYLTDANKSVAPCPAGKTDLYQSGKIVSKTKWPSGRIEIVAKQPATQEGLWTALWMRQSGGWQTANYGELDIMEWWSTRPKMDSSTTITGSKPLYAHHDKYLSVELPSLGYRTYAMEWSPAGVNYYKDGKLYATDTKSSANVDSLNWDAIFSSNWELRMETEIVKPPGDQYAKPPIATSNFNEVHHLIDSVKVYVPGSGTLPPPPNPANNPPTVNLTNPTNGQAFTTAPASINLTANASDSDGVKSVEFFDGTTSLGVDNTSPYSISVSAGAGTHNYTAKATDANSSPLSTTSTVVSVTVSNPVNPPPSTTLSVPTNISATAGNGQVSLRWDAVSGANLYTVRWGTGGNYTSYSNANGDQFSPTTNSYTVTGLTNGTQYNFSIRAKDSTGVKIQSAYSTSSVTATPVAPSIPNPPTGMTFKPYIDYSALFSNPCKMTISWSASTSPNIVGYDVSFNGKTPIRYKTTSVTLNITSGFKYDITVKAVNNNNVSSTELIGTKTPNCNIWTGSAY